jgi:hypothetical protein
MDWCDARLLQPELIMASATPGRTGEDVSEHNQFDIVDATFQPQRIDSLKPEARNWIGVRAFWEASWTIEKGPYKNQWAFVFKSSEFESDPPPFSWVPECDLNIHALVSEADDLTITDCIAHYNSNADGTIPIEDIDEQAKQEYSRLEVAELERLAKL